jgi:RNA polymerase-binding protein DksA
MEFESIRKDLTAQHEKLLRRLPRVETDGRHAEGLNPDFAEQAVERQNDEVLHSLDDAIRAEIAQIEKALARLDDGSYGRCEGCGRSIATKRLEALPFATRCVACERTGTL